MSDFHCLDCAGATEHLDNCVHLELAEAIKLYGFAGVHPMANLFPMMTAGERAGLTENAREDGWLHPVTLTEDGHLLDGRNRLVVSVDIGLDIGAVRRQLDDELEAFRYVFSENYHRRSLTSVQRAELAVKATEFHESARLAAKARQVANLKRGSQVPVRVPGPERGNPDYRARDEVAAQFGVSGSTVERMAAVMTQPDLLQDVRAGQKGIRSAAEEARARARAAEPKEKVTISLYDHNGKAYDYDAPNGKATFNTTNDSVDWARFTWNPVTGCLHGCFYCYAREIANQTKMAASYPAGFDPLFHPERLDAPKNTPLPAKAADDPAFGRVFVGSMADLFGAWVPEEWIERVFEACNAAPRWEYLFLTKFPKRYKRIDLPPAMWAGASVDSQKRVAGTEAAMRDLDVKVRWLSIEPLLEPLRFQDLSWCDLMVIGAQTDTRQPEGYIPSFAPPYRWVRDLTMQADDAGVPIFLKENLVRNPGTQVLKEMPRAR